MFYIEKDFLKCYYNIMEMKSGHCRFILIKVERTYERTDPS